MRRRQASPCRGCQDAHRLCRRRRFECNMTLPSSTLLASPTPFSRRRPGIPPRAARRPCWCNGMSRHHQHRPPGAHRARRSEGHGRRRKTSSICNGRVDGEDHAKVNLHLPLVASRTCLSEGSASRLGRNELLSLRPPNSNCESPLVPERAPKLGLNNPVPRRPE